MNYLDDRLYYLLEAYKEQRCAEQEINELGSLLEKRWNQIPLDQPIIGIDWKSMYNEIVSRSEQNILPVTQNKRSFVLLLRKVAVAAVVLLLISVAVVWLNQDRKRSNPGQGAIVSGPVDIPAGEEGAILTLADGSQVLLDSLGNGVITTQGKTTILIRNHQLVYDASAKQNEILYNTMTTPKGRQFELVLPDGSRVWLNAASSITYPTAFVGNKREVKITGEAYFEVAKHPDRLPFIVDVAGIEVEVLGTHFNINSYSDETAIRTTLIEGSVKVRKNNKSILLKPGEQTTESKGVLALKTDVDIDAVIAWKNGFFSFRDADLTTVMRQAARWYDVDIQFEGKIPEVEFSGRIGRGLTLNQFLKVLDRTRINCKLEGRTLTIKP